MKVKLVAVCCALFILAGCAPKSAPSSSQSAPPAASGSKSSVTAKKIGIIQLAENGAFKDMREGFIEKLNQLGYTGDLLKIDFKEAQGDVGTLNTICQEMARSQNDIVVTIATPAAQAYVNQQSKIPLIFISVTDPIAAGIMSSLEKPDRNATGTSNLVPVENIFKLADSLTPGIKTYGMLYNTGEKNAVVTVQKAKAYLDEIKVAYVEATVANSSEVQQAAEFLAGKADAIYVPIDSMVQSAMPQVARAALDKKKPVYGSSPVMVASGALATVSLGDRYMGGVSAEMADKYFKGTPITDIPAIRLDGFIVTVNKKTLDELGLKIPGSMTNVNLIGQ